MTRLAASLVLWGALVSAAARTNADDTFPPVVFPTIPAQVQSASDLVPNGWIVDKETRSDLNGDGVPDLMLLLRMNEPGNLIAGNSRGTWQLDTNPRILVVAFADKATNALSLALADHTLIPRHTNPLMEDPFSDISVVKGTLQVTVGSWVSAGSWSTSNRKFTFRHQDGCFKLIGYDALEYQRNTGRMSKVSVNYLTKRAKRSWGYSDDAMNDIWNSVEAADLLCLEEVGEGLDFAGPSADSGSGRARELLKATARAEPRWSTKIASLHVGAGDQSATFKDVRSTCSATELTAVLGTTVGELHECLDETPVRVTVVFAAGQLASKIEPDNELTYCVISALDRAHFDDLNCTFEADVSLP